MFLIDVQVGVSCALTMDDEKAPTPQRRGSDPVVEVVEVVPEGPFQPVEVPSDAESITKDLYDTSQEIIMPPQVTKPPEGDAPVEIDADEQAEMPPEEPPAEAADMPEEEVPAEPADMPPEELPAEPADMPAAEVPAEPADMPAEELPEEPPEEDEAQIAEEKRVVRELTSDRETDRDTEDEGTQEQQEKQPSPKKQERTKTPESEVTVRRLEMCNSLSFAPVSVWRLVAGHRAASLSSHCAARTEQDSELRRLRRVHVEQFVDQ